MFLLSDMKTDILHRFLKEAYQRFVLYKKSGKYLSEKDVFESLEEMKESLEKLKKEEYTHSAVFTFLQDLHRNAIPEVTENQFIELFELWRNYPDEITSSLKTLYDNRLSIDERITPFIAFGKEHHPFGKIDPSLISYLLAAEDYHSYPIFNWDIYTELLQLFNISKFMLSEQTHDYSIYLKIYKMILKECHEFIPELTLDQVYEFLLASINHEELILENLNALLVLLAKEEHVVTNQVQFIYKKIEFIIHRIIRKKKGLDYDVKLPTFIGKFGQINLFETEVDHTYGNFWLSISKDRITYGYVRMDGDIIIDDIDRVDVGRFNYAEFTSKMIEMWSKYVRKARFVPYDKKQFLEKSFFTEEMYDEIVQLLYAEKNMLFKGPPATGKTFNALRLAYSLVGWKNDERVKFVRFHEDYGYEDFVVGYRPDENGRFSKRYGVFYEICQNAISNPNEPYFLIIDEINYGDCNRIFGELLSVIDRDRRGMKIYIADEEFFIPENLYIIGTVNHPQLFSRKVDPTLLKKFALVDIPPLYNEKFKQFLLKQRVSAKMVDQLVSGLEMVNAAVREEKINGFYYLLGHGYFSHKFGFMSDEKWLSYLRDYKIRPFLENYFYKNPERARELLEKFE